MLRDNLVGLIEPMLSSAGAHPLALCVEWKQSSDDRPPCLENPRPAGAESTLTENAASPFHAEPRHERLIGTVRRECLDYLIPLNEKHLRKTLREWVTHYNQGRPHSALGPGIPANAKERLSQLRPNTRRHQLPSDSHITTREILGGLHHEYELERTAA